jgi:hypothetical protein
VAQAFNAENAGPSTSLRYAQDDKMYWELHAYEADINIQKLNPAEGTINIREQYD